MSSRSFFAAPQDHSIAKMKIATKYFGAWANVMKHRCKHLTYLDLCSGQGCYDDDRRTPGTPLRILTAAMEIPELKNLLRVRFYEKNRNRFETLKRNVQAHPAFDWLQHQPEFFREEVSEALIPKLKADDCTFCFLDPCGYSEVSLELLSAMIGGWGSDCLFYFCTHGIRRNIQNDSQLDKIERIFGGDGLRRLQAHIASPQPGRTFGEVAVIELTKAVNRRTRAFVLPFMVQFERSKGESHYIVFISKHPKGFHIMLDIMADPEYCAADDVGFPLYRYSKITQLDLPFEPRKAKLEKWLQRVFAERVVKVKSVVDYCHRLSVPCPAKHIKKTLEGLIENGTITQVETGKRPRKGTLPDWVMLDFRAPER